MKSAWRIGLSISTAGFTAAPIKRSRRKESISRNPMVANGHWGVAALEDKIVQQAVATILNQIYEEDFRGFSYGFRPGRSQHQALDALYVAITRKKVNWMLDCDIRSFNCAMQPIA